MVAHGQGAPKQPANRTVRMTFEAPANVVGQIYFIAKVEGKRVPEVIVDLLHQGLETRNLSLSLDREASQ